MRKRRGISPPGSLRIALVVGTLGLGGTETQLCRLAKELQGRGHVIKVFAMMSGGPLSEQLRDDGIPFQVCQFPGVDLSRPLKSLIGLGRFWAALRAFTPDVCHAFLPGAYMFAIPGAALCRVPVRIAARRSLSSRLQLVYRERALQRLSVALAHAIVANSRAVAADCASTEPATRAKLRVIPNAVDIRDVNATVRKSPATGIMVANLIFYKGHRDLIEAIGYLSAPPTIRLIGDGPERARLEELVRIRGLQDVLSFDGATRNMSRLMAQAQFSILASHHEGMPNAVMEAMACGLPVVATSVGGVPELIDDGVDGLLVPPGDSAALAEGIERIAADADLRQRLGAAARHRAQSWSWPRCTDAHEDLYRALLSYSRPANPRRRIRSIEEHPMERVVR